jgi:hypothetical protein
MHDGKELHLEITHRLVALGHRIGEVPAILSWPGGEEQRERRARTDWTKIRRLIASHLALGFYQGISRAIGPAIALLSLLFVFFSGWAVRNLISGRPSIYLVTLAGVQLVLWLTLVVGYFLLAHVLQVQAEVWRLQQSLALQTPRADVEQYYFQE